MFVPIKQLSSSTCALPARDIDTDRIIPARFLTTTTRERLGAHLFVDWRFEDPEVDAALTGAAGRSARILVAGPNFGCGSSREHAVWALADFGFRAVIAPSFADIFFLNALRNGVVPIRVEGDVQAWLLAEPRTDVQVDLEAGELRSGPERIAAIDLPPFERDCLLRGWDGLDYLLAQGEAIAAHERAFPA